LVYPAVETLKAQFPPLKLPAIPSATPLEVAQKAGHLDVAEYLKSVGSTVGAFRQSRLVK
jgi:hypothetical protein